jgi:hypothetical protein
MTPLIKLDDLNSEETLLGLGDKLLDVFEKADGIKWDRELQQGNMRTLIEAQKRLLGFVTTVPPRCFVFHWCRLLAEQEGKQYGVDLEGALNLVESNRVPESETE